MFVLALLLGLLSASNGSSSQELLSSKSKTPSKNFNTISAITQKPEYYQASSQSPQSYPFTFSSKPVYMTPVAPQPQPQPTMVIIAHPAFIPQNVLSQLGLVQQMVNYFQNNPQAKYQLLYGNQHQQQVQQLQQVPHPTPQSYVQAAPIAVYQPSYQPVAAAPAHMVPLPLQLQQVGGSYAVQQQTQPAQTNNIAQLAQSVVQQYAVSPKGAAPPAIITGLENFSPEQQAQIKAQLGLTSGGQSESSHSTPSVSQVSQFSSFSSPSTKATTASASMASHPTSAPLGSSFYRN